MKIKRSQTDYFNASASVWTTSMVRPVTAVITSSGLKRGRNKSRVGNCEIKI